MNIMISLFITYLYQPFLNLLVFFYWAVGQTPIGYDMGMAVILLTLLVRFILLPLSLSSHRSESERREIQKKVKEVQALYPHDPVARKKATKGVIRAKPRIVISEMSNFFIQTIIALTLWRIFSTGLTGQDLHLLYSWIPSVPQPYNLTFLGRFDLTHPDFVLNAIQAGLIFIIETIAIITSPYQVSKEEVVRVQLILPVVSFIFFAFMPAGKKLFVITTLMFSLVLMILRLIWRVIHRFRSSSDEENNGQNSADSLSSSEDSSEQASILAESSA